MWQKWQCSLPPSPTWQKTIQSKSVRYEKDAGGQEKSISPHGMSWCMNCPTRRNFWNKKWAKWQYNLSFCIESYKYWIDKYNKKTHFKIGCKTDLFALKLKDGFVNTSPLTFNYFEIVLMAYKTRAVIVFLLVRIPPLSDRNKIDDTHGHNTSNTILTTTLLPTKSCCFESVSYRKKYFSIDCTTM